MTEERDHKRRRADEDESPVAEADSGGGESMSIEETNKMRISLGLKPLNMAPAKFAKPAVQEDSEAKRKEKQHLAEELRQRIESAREKRELNEKLRATKTLGEASEGSDDDMESWVERNRLADATRKAEAERKAAEEAARKQRKAAASDDEEDGPYTAADLEGLKMKTDVTELADGETVIVTLADRGILDEHGNLRQDEEDELEDVLVAEQRKRDKAMKAAGKAKPLWEEDGKRRGLLDKYDEQDEAMGVVTLGAGGSTRLSEEDQRAKRQADMRAKLAEGAAALGGAGPQGSSTTDYLSAEEMAAMEAAKGKKLRKREKKERKLRAKTPEAEEGDTASLIEALEAEAGGGGPSDLARRVDRAAARQEVVARDAALAAGKRARFEAAVEKGNWASKALRPLEDAAPPAPSLGDDEADREMQEMMDRARRFAAQQLAKASQGACGTTANGDTAMASTSAAAAATGAAGVADSLNEVARLSAARRAEEQGSAKTGEVLTETWEFVRSIQIKPAAVQSSKGALLGSEGSAAPPPPPPPGGPPAEVLLEGAEAYADDGSDMDDGEEHAARKPAAGRGQWAEVPGPDTDMLAAEAGPGSGSAAGGAGAGGARTAGRRRGHNTGAQAGSRLGDGEAAGMADSRERSVPPELQEASITGERVIGRGLASVLGVLNDKGALHQPVEWGGRNNDHKRNNIQGLDEVYTGGRHEDRIASSVERALTKHDELGRVLTPKERFRQLCHQFHGIFPSKNQVDKKARQDAEYLATLKTATSEDPSKELDAMRSAQAQTGAAYVVLSGKNAGLGPSAGRSQAPRLHKRDDGAVAATKTTLKALKQGDKGTLGNLTPLLGDRKVEAMFGLMKPPAPRPPKQ